MMNQNLTPTYSSFFKRLIALVLDLLFLLSIVFGLFILSNFLNISEYIKVPGEVPDSVLKVFVWIYLSLPLVGILYRAFFESSKFRGTPGKIALRISVVDENFDQISFSKAFLRNFIKIFSGLFICIGFLMSLFNIKNQTLHDKVAHTFVINKTKSI